MPCERSSQPGGRRCLVQDRSGHQRENRKPKAILDLSVNEKKTEIQRVQQQTSKAREKKQAHHNWDIPKNKRFSKSGGKKNHTNTKRKGEKFDNARILFHRWGNRRTNLGHKRSLKCNPLRCRKEERKEQNRRNEKDEGFALENPMAPLSVQDRRSSHPYRIATFRGGDLFEPPFTHANNRPFIPGLEIPSQSTWQISIRFSPDRAQPCQRPY